ncbi:MAG: hypothetical protein MMC23_005547 [Stictis urceolatum]|nr:hypothetical protein [Stictis urceolata]
MADTNSEPGGFLLPTLPSPPPSVPSSSSLLPTPRSHPLKGGSQKETAFVSYVEGRLLDISGRYERRYNKGDEDGRDRPGSQKGNGYESFSEAARDLESVLDVIWVSGTRELQDSKIEANSSNVSPANLQIPLLLNVAGAASSYLPSFPFAPKRTFQLLQNLDLAFASLLNGTSVETGDPLPGFESGRKVTLTEKIRLRGLVESTRLKVARLASGDSVDGESRVVDMTTDDEDEMMMDDDSDEGYGAVEMEVARTYERTLIDLGTVLDGASNIGIT